MNEHTNKYLQQVADERAYQTERFGDDVAAGKDGFFFLALMLREFGELGDTYIASDITEFEHRATREAQIEVRVALQTRLVKLGAVIAAAYEAADRDIAHYADPNVDVVFLVGENDE